MDQLGKTTDKDDSIDADFTDRTSPWNFVFSMLAVILQSMMCIFSMWFREWVVYGASSWKS